MSSCLQGSVILPGDKSISHRALMFLALSSGSATIENLSPGQDVMSTKSCLEALGVKITSTGENTYQVTGVQTLTPPQGPLDCGNSGTTIRLLAGIIAGANISARLTGDESLQKRPMKRVIDPLVQMGGALNASGAEQTAPIDCHVSPFGVDGINYLMPMASAQVKSAVLLAGLFAPSHQEVSVIEPLPSRDHTERMLTALGALVVTTDKVVRLVGRKGNLKAQDIRVPGDISSAAFWMVGASICPSSVVRLIGVGLNPSRLGILEVFAQCHASVQIDNLDNSAGEPYGDITVKHQPLNGDITISPEMVPSLVDEIPILTILGLFNDGVFSVRGAEELKVKESNRLQALIDILKALQVDVTEYDDGFSFTGSSQWQPPSLDLVFETHHDHRLVMALEILNLRSANPYTINGKEWASVSYPSFFTTLEKLKQQ